MVMQNRFFSLNIDNEAEPGWKTQQNLIDLEFKRVDAAQRMQRFAHRLFSQGFVMQPHPKAVSCRKLFEIASYPFRIRYRMWRKGGDQYGMFIVKGRYVGRVSAADP